MVDFTVVGHLAIDRILTRRGERTQLGGPPTYMSLVAQQLGGSLNIVTKVGDDIPERLQRQMGELEMDVSEQMQAEARTTRFVLDYRGDSRVLSVESVCGDIEPGDVSGIERAIVLAPIVGEIPPSTVLAVSAELLALDPQGFIREIGRDGAIGQRAWWDEELLRRTSVVKASGEELILITGDPSPLGGLGRLADAGVSVAIATLGEGGSLVVTEGRSYRLPVYDVAEAVDPTGAGDVFLGSFTMEYLRGEDPLWCASVGTAVASCVVETLGPSIEADQREIRERSEKIYDGIERF
ncbi:MAG: hypothetical protein JSV27_00315 [Candidatus Bathyarchaeota archaeon]|nr:MAG: hypothetical protein JSV27_00315 [Candidatus Bathyarchaeota archaeon]